MIKILREIEHLLRKHGYVAQAEAVCRVIEHAEAGDQVAFERDVVGLSVWGGAGSVADADLRYGSPRIAVEATADNLALQRALVALAAALDEHGLGTPRTRDIAKIFRDWDREGA